ncbi:interactor of HORMAD1 protein 1 [Cheilinus undulatus]|uniref:interactor of HORMAD1 protein 1 n=1 Tax=Cheilinus undulatus TaxID=241271 RepID=UPI001BD2A71F|nr:interactor of HORMAD1 protein 1 [Cheilinus undulatus]XP_041672854.1 interactor of HORMAD1 protein 1 [Cheilinus undulatus]
MSHIRNIKEMLSIQHNRNMATNGYSNFMDSQLFFGSQFWPENSQGASQEMSLSSRTSQQSSQEGSDPKFLSSYHTKPLLFGDFKDKSKAFGVLDKFEEDRKKAKERTDSDYLTKELHNFRENLCNIQQIVASTERNTAVYQTVLEQFDKFSSTLQNNISSLQSIISQQFDTLLDKVNSQKEITTELEEKVKKGGEHSAELCSNLKCLKKSLDCMSKEQERERNMLEEVLKLISTLASERSSKPSAKGMVDSAIQTSPGLDQQISNTLQNNQLEATQLTRESNNLEGNQTSFVLQNPSRIYVKKKFTPTAHRRHKKRPLVPSRRNNQPVMDENSQPLLNRNKKQNVLCERYDINTLNNQDAPNPSCRKPLQKETRSKVEGRVIMPLNCWSQDSSSSLCPVGIDPILEMLSAESWTGTPVKQEGLLQLFDMDSAFEF